MIRLNREGQIGYRISPTVLTGLPDAGRASVRSRVTACAALIHAAAPVAKIHDKIDVAASSNVVYLGLSGEIQTFSL